MGTWPAALELRPLEDPDLPGEAGAGAGGGPTPFGPLRGLAPTSGRVDEETEVLAVVDPAGEVASVTVDGVPASRLRALEPGVHAFATPARAAPGRVEVRLLDAAGGLTASGAFTYVPAAARVQPFFSAVVPESGTTEGGTTVWLVGEGFEADSEVTIGGRPAAVTVVSSTLLRLITPAAPHPGHAPILVTSSSGCSSLRRAAFLYTRPGSEPIGPARVSRRSFVSPVGACRAGSLDLDRDGFTDLLTCSRDGRAAVLRALGARRYRGAELTPAWLASDLIGGWLAPPAAWDPDADGRTDWLTVSTDTWTSSTTDPSAAPGRLAALVAFAREGERLVVRQADLQRGDAVAAAELALGAAPLDFDGDGAEDLLLFSEHDLVSYRRSGAWTFERRGWRPVDLTVGLVGVPGAAEAVLVQGIPTAAGQAVRLGFVDVAPDGTLGEPRWPARAVVQDLRAHGVPPEAPVRCVDVDGDGHRDLVGPGLIVRRLSSGERPVTRFLPASDAYPFGVPWRPLLVADVDADGRTDVLCFDAAGGPRLQRFVLAPDGGVAPLPDLPAPPDVVSLVHGDTDRDGAAELLALRRRVLVDRLYEDDVSLSLALLPLGGGASRSWELVADTINGWLRTCLVGGWLLAVDDLAADRFPDVIGWSGVGPFVVTLGPGGAPDLPAATAALPALWATVAVGGDVTGDGLPDVVLEQATEGAALHAPYLLRGTAAGGLAAPEVAGDPASYSGMRRLLDVDGDGQLDLLGADTAGLIVRPGVGAGRFAAPRLVHASTLLPMFERYTATSGDWDGDGRPDFLFTYGAAPNEAILSRPGSLPVPFAPPVTSHLFARAVSADLDGDGREDVVGPTGAGVLVAYGDGAGGFGRERALSTAPNGASQVAVGDLDGSGSLDLVCFCAEHPRQARLAVFRGDGRGGFLPLAWIDLVEDFADGLLATRGQLLAEDLDGDGRAEVVFASGGLVTVFRIDPR